MKKKILSIVIIILSAILFKLICSYAINEVIIHNYNNGLYNSALIKTLYKFNFNQPYIVYYNEGNILYKKENYYNATVNYNKALKKWVPKKKVCDIRINLALSMIKDIDPNASTQTIYDNLEDAKYVLYEDNCASPTDSSGRSQEAEKLEEEIKELQKNLSEKSSGGSSNDSDEDGEEENEEDYEDIEEQLKEIEKEANASRQEDSTKYENMGGGYSYYNGKRW